MKRPFYQCKPHACTNTWQSYKDRIFQIDISSSINVCKWSVFPNPITWPQFYGLENHLAISHQSVVEYLYLKNQQYINGSSTYIIMYYSLAIPHMIQTSKEYHLEACHVLVTIYTFMIHYNYVCVTISGKSFIPIIIITITYI